MEVCLICTNNIIDKTKSVFDIDDEHKIQIKDILFDLNYKICIKDTGSDSICYECYVELLKIYNFRDICCILFDCEEDFVGCCQLCLEETDEFKFLSDCVLINNESLTVLEILNKICSYDLTVKYDGEQYLCKTCLKTCLDNYPFFLKCEKATEYWNNFILNKNGQICSGFDFSITEENSAIVKTEETDNESYKPNSEYCGSDSDPDYNTESDTESLNSNSIESLQKGKLYTCNVCSKTFEKLSSLANHKKVHNRNLLHCYTCMKGFKSKSHLISHMRKHINYLRRKENLTEDFSCSICGKTFYTNHELNAHIEKCVPCEMLYKCELCPKTFKHKNGRTQHEYKLHRLYKCDICPEKFKDINALRQHKFVHKGERPFLCDKCPKTFPNAHSLKQHKLCVHSTEYSYKCHACPKAFRYKPNLRVHEFLHTGKRPFMCEKCSKTFSCRNYLRLHHFTHLEEKSHECDICLKKFKYGSLVKVHKRNAHSEIKPYKCDLCPKTCKTNRNLNIHKTIHNTERIFKCTTCSKAFYSELNLIRHKKRHSLRKFYKCKLCLKEFIHPKSLRLHLEKNICNKEDQGPFICEFCSKEFKLFRALLLHKKIVHINDEKTVNNGPFKCDICKKEYKLLRILKIHMGMTHNKKN